MTHAERHSLCERFGGEARCTRIMVKQYSEPTGPNFDLVCGCDLRNPSEQKAFWAYRSRHRCRIVVMAVPCTPFGPFSLVNARNAPEAWRKSVEENFPVAVFGGHVALAQLADGLDFLLEQPQRSWLHEVEPWPVVKRNPRTAVEVTDQCESGART